jgi:hypothetical protein
VSGQRPRISFSSPTFDFSGCGASYRRQTDAGGAHTSADERSAGLTVRSGGTEQLGHAQGIRRAQEDLHLLPECCDAAKPTVTAAVTTLVQARPSDCNAAGMLLLQVSSDEEPFDGLGQPGLIGRA